MRLRLDSSFAAAFVDVVRCFFRAACNSCSALVILECVKVEAEGSNVKMSTPSSVAVDAAICSSDTRN